MIPETRNMASGLVAAAVALLMMGSAMGLGPGLQDHDLEAPLTESQILNADPVEAHEALLAKAGPALADRLNQGGSQEFDVILTGPSHEGVTQHMFPDRETAMEELDARAAPFFDQVERIVKVLDGDVVASWSAAPAIKVTGDLQMLQALALLTDAWNMALDHDDVLSLSQDLGVEPLPSGDPGTRNSEGRKMIQAEQIWSAGFEGEGINIAVIDTGVDDSHEAFKHANGSNRVLKFVDCVSGGCDAVPAYDDHGHGTHVSGTAAGSDVYDDPTHGTFEEKGVAPKANLFGVKFLGASGGGSFQGAMDSLQWSFDNDADLTSNSWGATCSSSSSGVITLVNQLNDLGMANVFAAGNSGTFSFGAPACAIKAIAVGAVDGEKNIAGFSSRGPCSDPTEDDGDRTCPHIVAKGVDVRSSVPRGSCSLCSSSGYITISGTSMSTPHAAGAVALMEEMKRHFEGTGWDTPNSAERQMLTMTAEPLGSGHPNNDYGWGLVQLLPVMAILEDSDEANILDSFGVSNAEVRQGESTTLSFSVTNLGGATATGDFVADLQKPDGSVETFVDEEVSLGLLDGASMSETITAIGAVEPGNYTFRGSFDYTWTNESGVEKSGSVSHEANFSVIRVFLDMELDGLANETLPALAQNLAFTVTSTGNEAAFGLSLEFTVPDGYEFLPGANFDPTDENSLYADPAPDTVLEFSGRTVLIWNIGDLPVGDSFSFTSSVLPTIPDDYRLLGTVKYQDGADQDFGDSKAFRQTVGLGV